MSMADQCFEGFHDWGDTVEHDRCGDDRCGVKCWMCDYISWACQE